MTASEVSRLLRNGAALTGWQIAALVPLAAFEIDAVLEQQGCAPAAGVGQNRQWFADDVYRFVIGEVERPAARTSEPSDAA